MFPQKKSQTKPTDLEEAIARAYTELKDHTPGSAEYTKIIQNLETLHSLLPKKKPSVDVNQVMAVGGNLAGIGMILGFERAHVVASKALGFVTKTKL